MNCSYCGFLFDDASPRSQCAGCGLSGGCRSVRCPRCGYEMPEEPAFFGRLRTRFARRAEGEASGAIVAKGGPDVVKLSDMYPGQTGTVVQLDRGERSRIRKLLALGVLPGSQIELSRRSPAYVFWLGFSQFAVDEVLARAVMVRLGS